MQQPDADAIRVDHKAMRVFVHDVARKADIPEAHAAMLADLLVTNDLRGVLSHGSQQMHRYMQEIRSGGINAVPNVTVVRETPTSVLMDGDFGLGYFPAYEGTLRAIEKAKQHGMAAMVARHHGHIGAAGIYARLGLEHDLLTFVTSGVQLEMKPGEHLTSASRGSPMSFSAPTLNEPPMVLDCGVTHGIQGNAKHRDALAQLEPGVVLRAIGFGTFCQAWGGLLSGLPVDPARAPQQYRAANQGTMIFTFQISLFTDPEQFKREMDLYVQQVRKLTPLVGTSAAYLPGGIEAAHEAAYRREGIPVGKGHRQALEEVAAEVGVALPWG